MLTLYSTGGSSQITLEQQMLPKFWEPLKRAAIRMLRQQWEPDSAALLENNPFEMWSGSNDFGDQFELLYMKTSLTRYLEFEDKLEEHGGADIAYNTAMLAKALEKLNHSIRFVAIDVDTEHVDAVPAPSLKITSDVVERALSDFEALARSKGGAVSGVDRVHTTLHGYFEAVCNEAHISFNPDSPTTTLFSLIRQHHPALQKKPPGIEADKVLRAMAQIVDVLNPVRNQKSMAHPNEDLLEEPEAMLIVNAVRTLLHYLNEKMQA
jgi:abortive infection Abi-like protein